MKRPSAPQRKSGLKRTQPKRDWTLAREKCENEEVCRVGPNAGYGECEGKLEAAHIVGRSNDTRYPIVSAGDFRPYDVIPQRIAPMCTRHHQMYDAHSLDLLPFLDTYEQIQAVDDTGSIESARKRTAPSQYRAGDSYKPEREEA